jgi:hypothetical protein
MTALVLLWLSRRGVLSVRFRRPVQLLRAIAVGDQTVFGWQAGAS